MSFVDKIKIEDFNRICRSCLRGDPSYNIYICGIKGENFVSILQRLFPDILSNAREDKMPQNLCQSCSDLLLQLYQFEIKFNRSQIFLRQMLITKDFDHNKSEIMTKFDEENVEKNVVNLPNQITQTEEIKIEFESTEIEDSTVAFFDNNQEIESKNDKLMEYCTKDLKMYISDITLVKKDSEVNVNINEANKFACVPCGIKKFETREDYVKHRKEVKHGRPKYPCEFCGKKYTKASLQLHIRTHTNEKPYECDICPRKFASRKNFQRHVKLHTGEKPFVCEYCGKGYIQKKELEAHRFRYHTGERPYMCEICGERFFTSRLLKDHRVTHSNAESHNPKIKTKYKQLIKCCFCQQIFPTQGILQKHKFSDHYDEILQCSECDKRFVFQSHLDVHLRKHTGQRPYRCQICFKNFATNATLYSHSFIHTGERPYKCKDCPMSFRQGAHLRAHKRIHTGEKPYQCPHCAKAFRLNGNLTVHLRLHTGERPYKCEVCPRAFTDLNGLKRHRGTHKEDDESDY